MSSLAPPLTQLPTADSASARLQRLAGLARLGLPGWAERLPAITPATPAGAAAPTVCIDSAAGRFWLRLEAGFDALCACAALPHPAQRDAVATLLSADALQRWLPGLGPCHAAFGTETPRGAGPGICIRLPGCEATLVAADERLMNTLQALLDRHPPTSDTLLARCGTLRLAGELLIERRGIGCSALARLRTGDVVLTRRPCAAQGGERATLAGRTQWRWGLAMRPAAHAAQTVSAWAQVDGTRMTLDTPFDWLDDSESTRLPPADAQGPGDTWGADAADSRRDPLDAPAGGGWAGRDASPDPHDVDDGNLPADARARTTLARLDRIELPLELSLPAPTLSLAELAALAPGDVVTLPWSADDAGVRLSVHGQTVGLGELVAVGGRLGVRIVRLAGAFTAPAQPASGQSAAGDES